MIIYFTDKKPFLRYCLDYHTPKIVFEHVKYYIENGDNNGLAQAKEESFFVVDRTKFVIVPQFYATFA